VHGCFAEHVEREFQLKVTSNFVTRKENVALFIIFFQIKSAAEALTVLLYVH
jgi:hypothetical protein